MVDVSKLREAIAAWIEAEKKSTENYESAGREVHNLLVSVGGYATTSADAKGFCQWYETAENWPSTGVVKSGLSFVPYINKIAPYEPEVGDRIKVLDHEHRALYFQAQARRNDVGTLLLSMAEKHGLHVDNLSSLATAARILFLEGVI